MELDTATRLSRWVKRAGAKTLHAVDSTSAPFDTRFVFIILSMFAAECRYPLAVP